MDGKADMGVGRSALRLQAEVQSSGAAQPLVAINGIANGWLLTSGADAIGPNQRIEKAPLTSSMVPTT